MITLKLLRLAHFTSYLLVASQLVFYLFVFISALKRVPIEEFLMHRKGVEPLVEGPLKAIYYSCLAISLLMTFIAFRQEDKIVTVTVAIALFCLLIDMALAVKGNMPINTTFNSHKAGDSGIYWENLRSEWLTFFMYRGVAVLAGCLSIAVGFLFGKR